MSNHNEETEMMDNIIKLKVNGSARVVNTIEDQKTARGLSLVCPFPALEVDIPIQFTNSAGEECDGSIHRIGVEDDPETGLPKLRLSVRNAKDGRETVMKAPSEELLAEASGTTKVPAEVAAEPIEEVEVSVEVPVDVAAKSTAATGVSEYEDEELNCNLSAEINVNEQSLLDGLFDELEDTATSELLSLDEIEAMNKSNSKDPDWVCYADMPIPGEFTERTQTRRRRKAIAVAAWMMVLGIATGGIFVLNKAGVLDLGLGSATKYMSAEAESQKAQDGTADLDALSQPEEEVIETNAEMVNVQEAAQEEAAPQIEQAAAAVTEEIPEEAIGSGAIEEEEAPAVAEAAVSQETEIILPTRWPAEFSTAYRLQNPNGVVVDVPGGLVKREGWMTLREDDQKIIRSIKAVQRENGARFIVYVNGNLPNFKTTPKSGGIRLSLYYDAPTQASSDTQEIAMLEK